MKFNASRNRYPTALMGLLTALVPISLGTAVAHPAINPDQLTTSVATVATTVTTTSSAATTVASTTSSTTLTTTTSVTTLISTIYNTPGGSAIPGFPWEAIIFGLIFGIVALGVARRRHGKL